MRPIRSVSVLIPTLQAAEFLERVLDALAIQRTDLVWDVHVIDSGSSDGTLECLQRRRAGFPVPLAVESIPPQAFDHGDTRNLLAARSRGDLLVFLTQDAIPTHPRWLATLARNFDDPRVGAAYCRNVPRRDCWPLTRVACRVDPGYSEKSALVVLPPREVYERLGPIERRLLYNFNDVASAVRRELWERHPFPRTMMGEDVLMARALLEAGFAVAYDAKAAVEHSHDYEPDRQRWRGQVDARFNAEWLEWVCVPVPADVPVLSERFVARDLAALRSEVPAGGGGPDPDWSAIEARARELRGALVQGLFEGGQAQRRYPRTAARADGRVRVLLVVAGHPRALLGAALTEEAAHARELGLALLARGHRVGVLGLTCGEQGAAFEIERADAGGLRAHAARCGDGPAGVAELRRHFAEQACEVVHTFGAAAVTPLVARATWESGLPWAASLRLDPPTGTRLGSGPGSDAWLSALAAADLCLVPSVAQRGALLDLDGGRFLEPNRVVPVVEGVQVSRTSLAPRTRARAVRFGICGATPEAIAGLRRAARSLPEGSWSIRAHALARASAAAQSSPQDREVELVGGLEPGDLAELFAEIDVAVALPRSFVEVDRFVQAALLHRVPLLVNAGFGVEELVCGDGDGLVVPHADERALSAAMRRFLEEPELRRGRRNGETEAELAWALEREVAELEFRYRGMACLTRDAVLPKSVVLDLSGARGVATGPAEIQGAEALLLRPGASATFSFAGLPTGPLEIELVQLELGCEAEVVLGGVVLLDGRELGACPLSRPVPPTSVDPGTPPDRVLRSLFRTWIDGRAHAVTVEARSHHVRIERVRALSHTLRALRTAAENGGSEQLRRAEALRVRPGPRLSAEALPALAVVVPTFDGREVLTDCLASLEAARYERARLRVLIVDNGSADGTPEHVRRRYPHAQVLELPRNQGFAAACNAGVRAAEGADTVVFLNNDMRVAPDFLIELVSPIARGECAATVAQRLSWDGERLDGAGVGATFAGIAIQPGYGAPPGPEHAIPRRTLFPCGGAMAISRDTFLAVGGFDEEFFAYYEDLDLGWRMWLMGHATHYVPTALAYHHHSHTSARFPPASVRLVMIRNSLLTCFKNYDDEHLARTLPALIALAVRRAQLATGLAAPEAVEPLRIERATPRELAPSGARAAEEPPLAIRALGAADLVALDDLLGRFDHWLSRRREVQARRVLPDREIFPMFLEPLACVEEDPAYRALQRGLLELYRVAEIFEQRP
jgi:GT2 family glycosyltransferase